MTFILTADRIEFLVYVHFTVKFIPSDYVHSIHHHHCLFLLHEPAPQFHFFFLKGYGVGVRG
uniref:Uncharacterized protein n=1 Tax=Rhizophora mucronata TaxID=61149 RepID=A0A2P2INI9_RHIMU